LELWKGKLGFQFFFQLALRLIQRVKLGLFCNLCRLFIVELINSLASASPDMISAS